MTKRVLITYDFLTTSAERGQRHHQEILQTFITVIATLPVTTVETIKEFDQGHFFALSDLPQPSDSVYCKLDIDLISDASIAYLRELMCDYDMFIGFELSSETRQLLTRLGICYVDIWLSAVRFYKDVMFEFHSNENVINAVLEGYRLRQDVLYEQAEVLTQHANSFLPRPTLIPNSCLLIGQVEQDTSVLCDGRFLSLLDFAEQIQALATQYAQVYVLKHPMLGVNAFAPIKHALEKHNNVQVLHNQNTYLLMMQEEIECIAGISSSVLTEAKYFHKDVRYFYKPVIEEQYIQIFHKYYCNAFWANILQVEVQKPSNYLAEDNYLRYKLNMQYAYTAFMSPNKSLDYAKVSYSNITNLYDFISNLDLDKRYIMYGFGSVGKLLYPHIKQQLDAITDIKTSDIWANDDDILHIPINQLGNYPNRTIIISSFLYNQEIRKLLANIDNPILMIEV